MQNKVFYFIGIGGIGMSSIARYLMELGAQVGGYDKTPSTITSSLEESGAFITFQEEVEILPDAFKQRDVRVIFTPAVPSSHPQLQFFEKQGNERMKRAAFLGEITNSMSTLAVAGTHGKTTTTSILAHFFLSLQSPFTAFVGGMMNAHKSNLISTGRNVALVEADDFDRSFLQLSPNIACITSTDADHLDVYGTADEVFDSYRAFGNKVSDVLVVEKRVPLEGVTYSIYEKADYSITAIAPEGFGYRFDLTSPKGSYQRLYFSQLGLHNLSNALAAFAMASEFGLNEQQLSTAFSTFEGVDRRLQLIVENNRHVLIDDYAHHPTEINAVFETLENAYPEERKCAIFQPHLFSRTRDFMDDFATALSQFDEVILLSIYPARELPIVGINAEALAEKISTKVNVSVVEKHQLLAQVALISARVKVVLGAGDIGLEVEKIKQKLI
jgi:UDP-N-acetylmuramate--alanine ligase